LQQSKGKGTFSAFINYVLFLYMCYTWIEMLFMYMITLGYVILLRNTLIDCNDCNETLFDSQECALQY